MEDSEGSKQNIYTNHIERLTQQDTTYINKVETIQDDLGRKKICSRGRVELTADLPMIAHGKEQSVQECMRLAIAVE